MTKDVSLAYLGFGLAPAYVEKSAIQIRIAYLYGQHVAPASRPEEEGETSYERMRARTQLLRAISDRRKAVGEHADEATVKKLNSAVENARAAGYTPAGIARMIWTPSDVSMFSRLPEADQRAILRQANDTEFERYITHAQMKLRAPMREERAGKQTEAAGQSSTPPRSAPPPSPRGRSRAGDFLQTSLLSAR